MLTYISQSKKKSWADLDEEYHANILNNWQKLLIALLSRKTFEKMVLEHLE